MLITVGYFFRERAIANVAAEYTITSLKKKTRERTPSQEVLSKGNNDQAHRRHWNAEELSSDAVPC